MANGLDKGLRITGHACSDEAHRPFEVCPGCGKKGPEPCRWPAHRLRGDEGKWFLRYDERGGAEGRDRRDPEECRKNTPDGGKGLDLFRIRTYGQRFGFEVQLAGRRCPNIPGDHDTCPGDIEQCDHGTIPHYCMTSGGTTVSVVFPVKSER